MDVRIVTLAQEFYGTANCGIPFRVQISFIQDDRILISRGGSIGIACDRHTLCLIAVTINVRDTLVGQSQFHAVLQLDLHGV